MIVINILKCITYIHNDQGHDIIIIIKILYNNVLHDHGARTAHMYTCTCAVIHASYYIKHDMHADHDAYKLYTYVGYTRSLTFPVCLFVQ